MNKERILECLYRKRNATGVEIASFLNLSAGTVYRHLKIIREEYQIKQFLKMRDAY
ncbi:MAG: winged helix-turn-helix domain-containing protein [Candidatus Omnitrophica bacterium]|nr:winged helix-turn-helix domain-containing protein [Candidatus Omnitrophota bacterium]